MAGKPGFLVYDEQRREYLETFRKPVKGVDAAVTMWTDSPRYAMRFKVYAAAASAAEWMNGDGRGACRIVEDVNGYE